MTDLTPDARPKPLSARDLSLWLQLRLLQGLDAPLLQHWAWQLCLLQALLTGLLAPMLASWQLLIWRRRAPS